MKTLEAKWKVGDILTAIDRSVIGYCCYVVREISNWAIHVDAQSPSGWSWRENWVDGEPQTGTTCVCRVGRMLTGAAPADEKEASRE